eukprot:CAMPEP_0175054436 /NCGR_PEP_ID=MMETSP0052_2-20121109/9506_1 /TAXON_ID=51329 ORGANISM="Polytomella parva, Strain SAG 63-3" /NCGR_SAMPLE_ID=MMETSP0052_2 /ASSEMBLY_ACC=CAM_ASM_000194 /LENGTH=449 /DNA_ID=CAMNT_0016319135 /DNA_START=201 /DNA_END=1548 /DNA_ORIENTATION=+
MNKAPSHFLLQNNLFEDNENQHSAKTDSIPSRWRFFDKKKKPYSSIESDDNDQASSVDTPNGHPSNGQQQHSQQPQYNGHSYQAPQNYPGNNNNQQQQQQQQSSSSYNRGQQASYPVSVNSSYDNNSNNNNGFSNTDKNGYNNSNGNFNSNSNNNNNNNNNNNSNIINNNNIHQNNTNSQLAQSIPNRPHMGEAQWEAEVRRLFVQERRPGDAVTLTAPSSGLMRCYVKRHKNMIGQTTHFSLFLNSGLHLMSARKRKKSKTPNIIFGLGNEEIFKDTCFCKLRANYSSTEFTLCSRNPRNNEYEVEEEGIVFQYMNSVNRSGPARILTILPSPDIPPATPGRGGDRSLLGSLSSAMRRELSPAQEHRLSLLSSRPPEWDEEVKTYTLDFKGRVRESSVKNFQLVAWDHKADRRGSDLLLQFGRQDDSTFILDFAYPFNAMRAFAAAIA